MRALIVISKFLAFICAIVLVVSVPLTLLSFNLWRVLFNPPLLKEIVTEIVVSSDLMPAALAWFSETEADSHNIRNTDVIWVTEPDVTDLVDFMKMSEWKMIKEEVLTRPILIDFVSRSIDSFYVWIDSTQRVPEVTLNMNLFINQVNTEHGIRSIEIAYQALPPCRPEQVQDFEARLAAAPSNSDVLYNLCQFPDPYFEDQFGDYLDSLQNLVKEIPVEYNLTVAFSNMEDVQGTGTGAIKSQLSGIRFWGQFAPLIILLLMLLVYLFGVRGLPGVGRWIGVPLVLGGVIAMILSLVYRVFITGLLSFAALSEMPEILLREFIQAVLQLAVVVFRPMFIQSLIITFVGLLILGVAAFLSKRREAATCETI